MNKRKIIFLSIGVVFGLITIALTAMYFLNNKTESNTKSENSPKTKVSVIENLRLSSVASEIEQIEAKYDKFMFDLSLDEISKFSELSPNNLYCLATGKMESDDIVINEDDDYSAGSSFKVDDVNKQLSEMFGKGAFLPKEDIAIMEPDEQFVFAGFAPNSLFWCPINGNVKYNKVTDSFVRTYPATGHFEDTNIYTKHKYIKAEKMGDNLILSAQILFIDGDMFNHKAREEYNQFTYNLYSDINETTDDSKSILTYKVSPTVCNDATGEMEPCLPLEENFTSKLEDYYDYSYTYKYTFDQNLRLVSYERIK